MACNEACQEYILYYADGISGFFTLVTWIIAGTQIYKHLRNLTNSHFQNKIITIIFMAPFYALTSCLTIITHDRKGYFALLRDIYESVLIYAFFYLLASYLAYDEETKEVNYETIYQELSKKGVRKHPWPMNYCLKPMILISEIRGYWFYRKAKLWILQYLAIKPLITFLLIIVYLFNEQSPLALILKGIVFISVCISVYYLVLFYQLLKEELAFAKPLLKFISVKGVLFFTFWQNFVIELFQKEILSHFSFSPNATERDKFFVIEVCENILVCFEMIILSSMAVIAFSHKDFKETERRGHFKPAGVRTLTRALLVDVVAENVVTAIEDIKELKEPLKDPFKSYDEEKADVETNELMSLSTKAQEGIIGKNVLNDFRVNVKEKPHVIPNYVANKYSSVSSTLEIGGFHSSEST